MSVESLAFLGTGASVAADTNLLVQIAVLLLLFGGAYLAKSTRYTSHGQLMKIAMIAQSAALIFWMGPSLLLNMGALTSLSLGSLVTVLHVICGAFAVVFSICTALHRPLVSRGLRGTMQITFLAWTLTVVLGIAFYSYYYVPL